MITLPPYCKRTLLTAAILAASATTAHATSWFSRSLDRPVTDEIFYFVLPDRFENGDSTNDYGDIPGTKYDNGYDATDKSFYHGGDLRGLIRRLDYIRGMGATAIWIAPVFKNDPTYLGTAGYHGYWPLDFTQIDPHFGTNADFKELVETAHHKGMKIYLDIVVNHTGNRVLVEECHNLDGSLKDGLTHCPYKTSAESETDPYTPFVRLGGEVDKSPAWLNDTRFYNNQGESTFNGESSINGDFGGLDDLKTSDPEVVDGMVDIFKFWISEFKIDGFRLDTVKHVDKSFWQQWTPAILAHAESEGIKNFHIFGEVFDGDPRNISDYTRSGKIPSALDFGLYYPMTRVFSGQSAPADFLWTLERDDMYTDADSHANSMMNFISNHDVGRFGHILNNELPEASNREKLQRMKLAHAFMYFGRGVPVVYYGDEQGFVGGEDADGREDMMRSQVAEYNDNDLIGTFLSTAAPNFSIFHPMYRTLRQFSIAYKMHEGLRNGKQIIRYAEETGPGMMALSRIDANNREYLIVMNTSNEAKTLSLPASADEYRRIIGGSQFLVEDGQINITLRGLGYAVLKAGAPIESSGEPVDATLSVGSAVNGIINGLVQVDVNVSNESEPLPLNDVVFSVKVGDGEWQSLGTDSNPSYRVFWDTTEIPMGTHVLLRAEVFTDGAEAPLVLEENLRVDVVEGMTLKFKKPDNWAAANIYYFDSAAPTPSWPGNAMRNHGDGWYSYEFPEGVQSATVIFNDGSGNQTENLNRQGSACYVDSTWVDDCILPFTVTFQAPTNWGSNLNVHYWESDGASNTAWPGEPMTALGGGWYSYTFPYSATKANIIFNDNGGNQTSNLYREGSGCYDIAVDAWSNECEIPAGPLGEIFMRGNMNGWGIANPLELVTDTLYRGSVDLSSGTAEFKIAAADWSMALGANTTVVLGEPTMLDASAGNIFAEITNTATYTVEVDASDAAAPVMSLFVAGPYGDTTLYLRGDMNGWSTNDPFSYNMDGTYSATVNLNPGSYNFKIADASWSLGTNFGSHFSLVDGTINVAETKLLQDQSQTNLFLVVETAGTYTFTLDATTAAEGELATEPRLTINQ